MQWSPIEALISGQTGTEFSVKQQRSVGGGCINSTYVITNGEQQYFVKTNSTDRLSMFEAEAAGLAEMVRANAIRVPQPLGAGSDDGSAFLVMEFIDFANSGSGSVETFGRELAALHQTSQAQFGWVRDNTIGSTPQINTLDSDWVTFWKWCRLGFQLELAARNGFNGTLQQNGERLMTCVDAFFTDYQPRPALLHGDLWSGNYAMDTTGRPVIFDPAVYYGDHEADLAMTELFGSLPRRFYAAYDEVFPIDPGYRVRKVLYNLYHILNHLNLFGGGYRSQAEHMISSLLSEAR